MWMGGHPPLGYDVKDRKLVVNETEAALVRSIFERFVRVGSVTTVARSLAVEGIRTKRHRHIDRGYLYILLNNRTYIGDAVHKGVSYPGEHQPIISRDLWDKVHSILQESPRKRAQTRGQNTPALLKGLLFGPNGLAFTPAYICRGKRPHGVVKRGPEACHTSGAAEVRWAVVDQVRSPSTPEIIVRTWKEAREHDDSVTEEQSDSTGRVQRTRGRTFSASNHGSFSAVERVEIKPIN
jgi:hypothetical protein